MKHYYGKHPAKRDLKAHHNFMMLIKEPVMKCHIELTDTEQDVLKRIIAAKLETKNDELAHANAYATELIDPDHPVLLRMWEELNA